MRIILAIGAAVTTMLRSTAFVVIRGDTVKVYLNHNKEPSIEVGTMFDGNEKRILGLCGGHFYFANFQYKTVNDAVH